MRKRQSHGAAVLDIMYPPHTRLPEPVAASAFVLSVLPMGVTLDRYVRSRQIGLAHSFQNRAKVYLDLRFWIIARDVAAGLRKDREECRLLDLLRRGVAEKKIICPISESTFMEVLKQGDGMSRMATAILLVESACERISRPQKRYASSFKRLDHSGSIGADLQAGNFFGCVINNFAMDGVDRRVRTVRRQKPVEQFIEILAVLSSHSGPIDVRELATSSLFCVNFLDGCLHLGDLGRRIRDSIIEVP